MIEEQLVEQIEARFAGSSSDRPGRGVDRPSGPRPLLGVSVRDALESATIPLRAAGVPTARLDAKVADDLAGIERVVVGRR